MFDVTIVNKEDEAPRYVINQSVDQYHGEWRVTADMIQLYCNTCFHMHTSIKKASIDYVLMHCGHDPLCCDCLATGDFAALEWVAPSFVYLKDRDKKPTLKDFAFCTGCGKQVEEYVPEETGETCAYCNDKTQFQAETCDACQIDEP